MTSLLYVVTLLVGAHAELHGVRLRHDNFNCFDHKPKIANGYYEVLRPDGHVIRAHCDSGFELVGSGLRLCQQHEKRFTGKEPRCQDVDECQYLANITSDDEGSALGSDDDSGDAPEPCHPRARCINTHGSYKCECEEGLRGSGFHCQEPKDCVPPATPEHAHILQKSKNIIRFYCHPDYSIHGNETLVCNDGRWSSAPPSCVPGWKTCADPGVPSNGYRLGNRFYLGSVARFWCRKGYELVGPKFIICRDDTEEWTSKIPECVESQTLDEPALMQQEFQDDLKISTSIGLNYMMDPDKTEDFEVDIDKAPKPAEYVTIKKDNDISYDWPREQSVNTATSDESTVMNAVAFGWLAEVHFSNTSPDSPMCMGAFICNDWVLVPARCLQQFQDNFVKLLEPEDLMVFTKEEKLKVLKIYRHPRYFLGHHGHDVAVMKVEKRLLGNQIAVDIPDGKSPTPSLVELWSRESQSLEEVTVRDHHECPQEGPYRLSSDTICVQSSVFLGSPLVARWKFPDEPERQFLLAVSKVQDSGLFTDVRKHHHWILAATEGCTL